MRQGKRRGAPGPTQVAHGCIPAFGTIGGAWRARLSGWRCVLRGVQPKTPGRRQRRQPAAPQGSSGSLDLSVDDLLHARIQVHGTVDARVQHIVNEALVHGLARYERRIRKPER